MLEAYQIYEDETSQSTGVPIYISRSSDPNIGWDIETFTDNADRELQTHDAKLAEKKNPPKGMGRIIRPVMMDGSPVPEGGLAREQFYTMMETGVPNISQQEAEELGIELHRPPGGYDASEYG